MLTGNFVTSATEKIRAAPADAEDFGLTDI